MPFQIDGGRMRGVNLNFSKKPPKIAVSKR